MSGHPLTKQQKRDTMKWFRAANGNVSQAARLAGLLRSTMAARVRDLGLRDTYQPVDRKDVEEAKELARLRKENTLLREQLHAKAKTPKIPKVTLRAGTRDSLRVIIPDSHGRHIDPRAFAAFMADMRYLIPDEIVGVGDHLDCGGFLAKHHTLGYVAQLDESSYADDLKAWEEQLNMIQSVNPKARVVLLEGNHEARVERHAVMETLGNAKDAELVRRALCPQYRLDYEKRRIEYVRYGEIHPGHDIRGAIRLGKCWFTHGNACGPGAAKKTAEKFGAPVVYGHTHTPAAYFGKSVGGGVQAAWNFGTLAKFAPRFMHNNPDNWGHGYGIQFIASSGHFTTIHVPIINGVSFLPHRLK